MVSRRVSQSLQSPFGERTLLACFSSKQSLRAKQSKRACRKTVRMTNACPPVHSSVASAQGENEHLPCCDSANLLQQVRLGCTLPQSSALTIVRSQKRTSQFGTAAILIRAGENSVADALLCSAGVQITLFRTFSYLLSRMLTLTRPAPSLPFFSFMKVWIRH